MGVITEERCAHSSCYQSRIIYITKAVIILCSVVYNSDTEEKMTESKRKIFGYIGETDLCKLFINWTVS